MLVPKNVLFRILANSRCVCCIFVIISIDFCNVPPQAKQKDVAELLARADDLAGQNRSYQEVYAAMAESLGEAWKDLNAQLDYRKMLLDQSIAFHQRAQQVRILLGWLRFRIVLKNLDVQYSGFPLSRPSTIHD